MQQRIRRVLLVSSGYDAFMLEEDGRIDEQIFNEYVSLNLRYPPVFIHTSSAAEALKILKNDKIDLVIEMLSVGGADAFNLAKTFKEEYESIPVVVLTPFNREVSLLLKNEDLSAVDYIFCWLGNADLLLAIIKLLEDKMNAPFDVQEIGVQSIILVEDSIRYTSVYLPALYKVVLSQSRIFAKEALNEHQQMLRMRGRPKILLAQNYKEAIKLFEEYKTNLIGVISDVSYKISPTKRDTVSKAGLEFCRLVKNFDKNIPFLLQSSDISNKELAKDLGAGFLHKYTANLNKELKDYVINNFAFGPFKFIDPKNNSVYCEVSDLRSLQKTIQDIPEYIIKYHAQRDDFSKWLNARALFPIAKIIKAANYEDFKNLNEVRSFIVEVISEFRSVKGRGIIAEFHPNRFDEYLKFSRIGLGSIGGKARGLAFVDQVIKKYNLINKYENVSISIPRTVVISTEFFDKFLDDNNLHEVANSELPDDTILKEFVKSRLPGTLIHQLKVLVDSVKVPIAIRSSSKLEDSYYQPFAGIYKTYMIPMHYNNTDIKLEKLCQAIKCVYASVFFATSKAYMKATSNVIDEEKMGIIIQEIAGDDKGGVFHPTLSGVARSINFYPIENEKPQEGIVNIAYGLGKYIVDGGISLRFSPYYKDKILQLSSSETALKETQRKYMTLDLEPEAFYPTVEDSVNILTKPVKDIENDKNHVHVLSYFDYNDEVVRDYSTEKCKPLVGFKPLLSLNRFHLNDILKDLLMLGQKEMNNAIEIEFALNINSDTSADFYFLQIRPIVETDRSIKISIPNVQDKNTLLYSNNSLGNGTYKNVSHIVYVNPDTFKSSKTNEIALELETINKEFLDRKDNYVLIGYGRWGSSDANLGIPVKWPQISQACVICEIELKDFKTEPSQGTHFFQNLTSFSVGYISIQLGGDAYFNKDLLNNFNKVDSKNYVSIFNTEKPLEIIFDGAQRKSLIAASK